jgi:DNA recombination protein RmuC
MLINFIYLIVGLIISWLFARVYFSGKLNLVKNNQDSLRDLCEQFKSERDGLSKERGELQVKAAAMETRLRFLQSNYDEQKESISKVGETFRAEFQNLAHDILESKSRTFSETSEKQIKNILDPLKSEIKEFKEKVDKTYADEAKERHSLGKHIEMLVETSGKVGLQADNLASALKANVKQQGNWGEMLLESILEHSGLTRNREYFVQEFIKDNAGNIIKDELGNGLQPDVTIIYPDKRKVIVDSKVSMIAWDQFLNETDPELQKSSLEAHVRSIKSHVDGLSKKNYPKYANAMDYVIMFVAIEPAFLEAIKQNTGLWKYAYNKQVLIVGPTNLLMVLKIIADLWRIEQQSQNAIQIAEKAGEIYDKLVLFMESLEGVGSGIKKAGDSYDAAMKQLATGNGNAIRKLEEIKKMGAKARKSFSDSMIRDASNGTEIIPDATDNQESREISLPSEESNHF